MRIHQGPDKTIIFLVLTLVVFGFLIFSSAAFGLLTRSSASLSSVLFNQFALGLGGGVVLGLLIYLLPVQVMRKYAIYAFGFFVLLTLLVFIRGIGFEHNGAARWIHIGSFSLQPSEPLKLAFILFFASWLAAFQDKLGSFKRGFLPTIGILAIPAVLLVLQPDNGTMLTFLAAGMAMLIAAGAKWKHLGVLALGGIMLFGVLIAVKPYALDRVQTFLNPSNDPYGSSYQIRQSLVAIGSGQIAGRGFGQSLQKFELLPEPIGDSIFAVLGEEFGFIGATVLIVLFLVFGMRGLVISGRLSDPFARLAALGIVIIILAQAYLNIGAMLGVFPLTGVPLPFVSHGGTALFVALAEIGVLLKLSRYAKEG